MATTNPGTRKYMLLGRLVEQRHPAIAQNLFLEINSHKPLEKDFKKIIPFYSLFCDLNVISEEELSSEWNEFGDRQMTRTERGNFRRIFVASMIHIFSPASYHHPADAITFPNGLASRIGEAMRIDNSVISGFCKQVITWEKNYEDFQKKVILTVQQLHNAST